MHPTKTQQPYGIICNLPKKLHMSIKIMSQGWWYLHRDYPESSQRANFCLFSPKILKRYNKLATMMIIVCGKNESNFDNAI
jgi:hypothetical protein